MPPVNLLIKPVSCSCNIKCKYSFYNDKMMNKNQACHGKMSIDEIEKIIMKTIEFADEYITFGFQGGEPMLAGLDFYKKVCGIVRTCNYRNIQICYTIQTNGICIDEEWAEFFKENNFMVDISLDGTRAIHDKSKMDIEENATLKKLMESIKILKSKNVQYNILTIMTECAAQNIEMIYKFFTSEEVYYQQYIPCIEPIDNYNKKIENNLTEKSYISALKKLFDLWYKDIINGLRVYNSFFENIVGIEAGYSPESCDMHGKCSKQYIIESDCSVYPCDFYVHDEYRIGNLLEDSFYDIDEQRNELEFIEESEFIDEECYICKWKKYCNCGCKRYREYSQEKGMKLNKYKWCNVYKGFFPYAIERIHFIAECI